MVWEAWACLRVEWRWEGYLKAWVWAMGLFAGSLHGLADVLLHGALDARQNGLTDVLALLNLAHFFGDGGFYVGLANLVAAG